MSGVQDDAEPQVDNPYLARLLVYAERYRDVPLALASDAELDEIGRLIQRAYAYDYGERPSEMPALWVRS